MMLGCLFSDSIFMSSISFRNFFLLSLLTRPGGWIFPHSLQSCRFIGDDGEVDYDNDMADDDD